MANRLCDFEDVLLNLCKASLAARDQSAAGPACAKLIKEVILQGPAQFVEGHTQTPGRNEYCLNGKGLKLVYDVECYRDGDGPLVYVGKFRISGDQVEQYPAFVRAAKPILESANNAGSADGVKLRAA
jgi:hypothetical protein